MSSGASAPILVPSPGVPAPTPTLVPPKPKPSKGRRFGWIIALILAAVAVERGVDFASKPSPASTGPATVRTATVSSGPVERTVRLTGTTGAERYASLVTPRLRGNRVGGGGRDGSFRSSSRGGGGNQAVQSNAGGSGSSSSSGSSVSSSSPPSSSASGVGTGANVTSTNGLQTGGGSQAFRSATSRVSRGGATPPRAGTTGGGTGAPGSSSSTSSNLGSTSGSLMNFGGSSGGGGGGGGGGGSSEFMLVLQDAAAPGSRVKKGDIVGEFDRQYMLMRLDDYHASVSQMEASIRKLKAEIEVSREAHVQTIANAKADLEKALLDVKTIPVLSAIDSERVKLVAEEAEARHKQLLAEVKFVEIGFQSEIRNAEMDLQQSRIELRRAEANADRMLIKAPIDGLAAMQTTFRGTEFAQIQPGDQLFPGMTFMKIVDLSSMVVTATVNQVDVDSLRIGQKATVRFDAYPDLEVPASVAAIGAMTSPGGARASYLKHIPVILKIEQMDPRIIPDLSVSADVVVESEEQAAAVAPLSSVFRDGHGSAPYVFVKQAGGFERREVELGVASNVQVAVRSGLKPGEQVAEDPPALPIS